MNKETLNKIARQTSLPKKLIEKVVNKTFNEIKQSMLEGKMVMIRSYIKFVCSKRKTKIKNKKITINQLLKLKTKNK
jgi:nucleoid DNA-binding protein